MFIKPTRCVNYWFVVLYYPKSASACKKLTLIIIWLLLSKNKWKTDLIVLTKGFIENLGDTTMILALIGFLCILGIQYILDNWSVSIGMLSIPNLLFNFFIFLSIISFADKLPALIKTSKKKLVDDIKVDIKAYITQLKMTVLPYQKKSIKSGMMKG